MNNFVVLKTSAEMDLENSRTLKSESRGKYRKAENRILLVEDNIIIASIQTKSLNKAGHTVIHVSSGEDAVQFCSENRDKIDLILMDIDLGNGIDGTEAAEIILEQHNIPLIFLSAHTEDEIVRKTENITSYGYVVKNTGITVLNSCIQMAFRLFRAAVELEEEKEYLRATFESMGDAVITTDQFGKIRRMNFVAEKLTGWKFSEAEGKTVQKVYQTDSFLSENPGFNLYDRLNDSSSDPTKTEHTHLISRNGKKLHVTDTVSPIRDSKGRIIGAVIVFRDMTEDCRIKLELIESEERFRSVVEWFPQPIVVHKDYKILYANPATARMFHTDSPSDIIGHSIFEKQDSSFHEISIDRVSEHLETGKDLPVIEQRFTRFDGTVFAAEVQGTSIVYDGNPAILSCMWDITERKRKEKALKDSHLLYSDIFYSSPTAIALFRKNNGCFSEVNDKFLELTGYELDEVLGRNSSEIESFSDPEFRLENMIGIHCYETSPCFEAEIRKKSGEKKEVMISARNVCIENEDYILAHYLYTD